MRPAYYFGLLFDSFFMGNLKKLKVYIKKLKLSIENSFSLKFFYFQSFYVCNEPLNIIIPRKF